MAILAIQHSQQKGFFVERKRAAKNGRKITESHDVYELRDKEMPYHFMGKNGTSSLENTYYWDNNDYISRT